MDNLVSVKIKMYSLEFDLLRECLPFIEETPFVDTDLLWDNIHHLIHIETRRQTDE